MQNQRIQKGNFNVAYPAATNPIITNQAMEFLQSEEGFVAVRDVPLITVPASSGQLAFVSQEYLNRDEVKKRSSSMTEAEKGTIGVSTASYTTDERALEYILSAADAARLGYDFGFDAPQSIPKALAHKGNIHIEGLFSALWASGSWYRTVTGNVADSGAEGTTAMNRKFWSDATVNPIDAILVEKRIFLLRTGMMPTNLRLGYMAFERLASHPLVRAQASLTVGGQTQVSQIASRVTEQQLGMLLGMKVSVSWGIRNTSTIDGSPTNELIIDGNDALMTFDVGGTYSAESTNGGPPRVTLNTPTGFARVAWDGVAPNGLQVRGPIQRETIGSGGSRSWILDLYQGFVIVDPKFGTYFNNMVA